MLSSESHQSFAALVKKRPSPSLVDLINADTDTSMVLMLDSIYDPQNLGSILRAAECFNVDAVIWSKNRGADFSPVVSKASVGASELLPIIKVSNLSTSLKQLQKAGFWSVAASCSPPCEDLFTFDFPEKTVLIMGSEGKGLRQLISKNSDYHLRIPLFGKIDSLNVSQATSIILSHHKAQQLLKN